VTVGQRVELQIPPRSDHLALVRLVVEGAARLGSLPDRRVDDLRLAVSEACTNAVDASQAAASEAPVTIAVELLEDEVAVTVTDHAGGFEVDAVEPAPAATDPARLGHEHGLGIPLMRSLVDELTFRPTGDGTAVRLLVRG
jgi:serine/threonine-protein kinase RsbW